MSLWELGGWGWGERVLFKVFKVFNGFNRMYKRFFLNFLFMIFFEDFVFSDVSFVLYKS